MAGELTVSERILLHLSNYVKYEDKFETPFDITQDGIAQACMISRAHAAIELKKLKSASLIEERLSHVKRGKTRRKVYFLTPVGKTKAADVVQYVKENGIDPMVDASRVAPELSSTKTRSARKSSPIPPVKLFVGREKELEAIRAAIGSSGLRVLSVRGIAGIGKTTLVAKAVSGLSGYRVFWFTAKAWDTPRSLAEALGKFFQENGCRKLSSYISTGKFELGELSFLLEDELAENGYIFVFDDADASEGLQEFLKMFVHSSGSAKTIVTAESEPRFYERSDVIARKDVAEIELGGLDRDAALELLRSRGIEGEVGEELARVTKGHPLSLEMVTESSISGAKYQIARFFEEKFYAQLSDEERMLLQLASVFQHPFPRDAIPRDLRHVRKGSMLREVAPGRFEIHASLRDFVYSSMTDEERSRWHSVAADYYLRAEDPHERLYHLIRAGRSLEAEMLLARMGEELLARGNVKRLWNVLKGFEPTKPRYREAAQLVKARLASMAGDYGTAWAMLESIADGGEGPLKAEALIEMGAIKSKKSELGAAAELFSKALDQARDLPGVRAKALRGLGVVEAKLGSYAKAQELLERSAKDALAAMDTRGMLLAHLELGNVFIGKGMYEQAIDHFSKCAAGFGPVELTGVHINMGIASAFLGRYDEARVHLENAVRLADETGQPRSRAYALTSLAEILLKAGRAEEAKERCFSALEVFSEIQDPVGLSTAYANLGMAERVLGELAASEEHYRESLAALEGLSMPRTLATRKMEFGMLKAEKGEFDEAKRLFGEARDMFEGMKAAEMVQKIDEELARLG